MSPTKPPDEQPDEQPDGQPEKSPTTLENQSAPHNEPASSDPGLSRSAPQDTGTNIARYMIIGFWVLLVFFGYTWAERHLAWMENPNSAPASSSVNGKFSVQLAMNRRGHYVTNGKINQSPAVFLLDTGATSVSLSAAMAQELGLKPGQPVTVSTANGLTTGWRVRLDSVSIGALELRDVEALINSGQDDNEVLLGMSFLRHFKLVQQDRTLTIEQY